MGQSIPATQIVQVNPSVLSAAGSALALVSLFLSNALFKDITSTYSYPRVPSGTVKSFAGPTNSAVAAFFGGSSAEAAAAAQYFAGPVGAEQLPQALLFGAYNQVAVGAYLWGGSLATLTLAQLQAITGNLSVVMDGYTHTISAVNLSGAASFSAAAALLQTAFAGSNPSVATVTGQFGGSATGSTSGISTTITLSAVVGIVSVGDKITGTNIAAGTTIQSFGTGTGGNGTYNLSQASTGSVSGSCTLTSQYLNVTAVTSGVVQVGQVVAGAGVTVGTQVTALGTGTGGIGTYLCGNQTAQGVASETITTNAPNITVTFDGVTSAFVIGSELTAAISTATFATGTAAAPLAFTQSTGAYLSQGAAAASPATTMAALTNVTQNFVTFMTVFDPDNGAAGGPIKQLFSQWNSQQDDSYLYAAWDTDVGPQNGANDAACFAQIIKANNYQGTAPVSANDYTITAALCGSIASIDTSIENGRQDAMFTQFPSATPTVTNGTVASNLTNNGYSFYGTYGSRAESFTFFSNGFCSGAFAWIDSYVDQIWLNANLQAAVLAGLINANSVPYNSAGYSLIEAWCQGPIDEALNFGAIRTGVALSPAQIAQVNQSAGQNIAPLLQTRGYYLQVQDASPAVRAARGSPPVFLWYTDGQSVQQIILDSIELQ